MRRNSLYILIFLIVGGACLANTGHAESCNLNKESDSSQIPENAQEITDEGESQPPKKELLPLGGIVSSLLKVPGDVVECIADIPLEDIVSSTLKVPGDAVEFVADIPYGQIVSSTLEISAEVVEIVADIPWYIWFASFCCCHCD